MLNNDVRTYQIQNTLIKVKDKKITIVIWDFLICQSGRALTIKIIY